VREPSHENGYHIDRDPLWQHQPVAKPFNAMAWYQCDQLGTPMELTDQRGEIAWSATYQAWRLAKEKRADSAIRENIRNPLRFQGQYFDTETGLHYNRYRYYDPQVGRFISKDPIGFAGGLNVYAYAPNPVGWVDPFGLARVYRNAPYHGATDNPIKSRAPSNGQAALDNSSQVKESSPRRIGVDIENNELVILDRTQVTPNSDEEYHGHVRCWCDLHTDQQNTLRRAQQVTSKGKTRRQP
jgi:RHS repeat-associated protein